MSALVFLQSIALLLVTLGAATVAEPLVSRRTSTHRRLLLGFASLAVPIALFALLLFGLRILLD
ncbi:hypothetical protein LMG27952_03248 [Paraburkholderia hiiakae]|uniref:Uncharacterized protein n=1 Tax=Paraburkholderia hiiakae TaxID=1081782 RepID=A0ABM8NPV1_9BURK|nr:hypothetical protein [Paraburkholderia hiiakae]CAD6537293.1 hypothetical protein LMG27952_03248 [Paraburkholderia hiiakae]